MDEDRIPSEYDADDVEGHRLMALPTDDATDDDVAGHRLMALPQEDSDDVEGHRMQTASPAVHDDGTGEGFSTL